MRHQKGCWLVTFGVVLAAIGGLREARAAIILETYTNRAAFDARLGGSVNVIGFDDIDTTTADPVAFAADRYRASTGAVITALDLGGQYVSRTFGYPYDFPPVSQPNMYAPGPVGGTGHVTYVTFFASEVPGQVAGFGVYFIDADYPLDGPSSLTVLDANDAVLGTTGTISGPNGSQLFAGLIAINTATDAPAPVIAKAQLTNGAGWPGNSDNEGVALDDFVFSPPVPEPAALTLLALGGLAVVRRRRR